MGLESATVALDGRRAFHLREMARHFGTVGCQRKGGRVYWFVDCRVDGKRLKLRGFDLRGRWVLFADEAAARAALEEIRADLRRGLTELQAVGDFLPTGNPDSWFVSHWRRFLTAREAEGRQLSAARLRDLNSYERRGLLEPLARVPVHTISYGTLEDWRNWLQGLKKPDGTPRLAPKSVRHALTDVGACLHWLVRRGDLGRHVEMPSVYVPEYAPKIPTPEAQDRLLAEIPWELRGAFLARGRMGLRPSEAVRANVEDYDLERDVLTVRGKGGRVRFLPADAEVARWVRETHGGKKLREAGTPLFPNPRSPLRRWDHHATRKVLLKAMKRVGLKLRPNEAMRHAFATDAVNRGVALERVGHYLGHSDTRTTRRYAKLAGEGLVDVLRPLGKRPPRDTRGH